MPVPTDTFWNIKRLNRLFALTALVLLALMSWAVLQDYDKAWRAPQRNGRVWQAAYAEFKAERALTPEDRGKIADFDKQIEARNDALKHNKAIDDLEAKIRDRESQISNLQFRYNLKKATVGVDQGKLEKAKASGDTRTANHLSERLKQPLQDLARDEELMHGWKDEVTELRAQLGERTRERDILVKDKAKLEADRDAIVKKRNTLEPQTARAKLSAKIRAMPLMQFINPSEKVQQTVLPDVLTDVAFLKVATIDRCATCHVNISDKEFSEERQIKFLEEEVANVRGEKLPAKREKSAGYAATFDNPGAVAAPEFWHSWSAQLNPLAVRKNIKFLKNLADTVGPIADVTYDDKKVAPPFAYDPTQTNPQENERQNAIVDELLKAWTQVDKYDPGDRKSSIVSKGPRATVKLRPASADATKTKQLASDAHTAALRYPEEIRTALEAQLPADVERLLRDRYRRHLIADVNVARPKKKKELLDDSRVQLAHPRLDLYVDVDSKHSIESVGCTSCHDGSGQETNFVLAAHTPRQIWVDENTGAPVLPAQLTDPPKEEHKATMASMLHAVYPAGKLLPEGADDIHFKLEDAHEEAAAAVEGREPVPERLPEHAPPTTYLDPVTGAKGRAVPQGQYWSRTYEGESGSSFEEVYHYWDWPMRPPEYLQANCVRCHTQVSDIREHAPVVYEGRMLFANLGCANCHQMDSIKADPAPAGADPRAVLGNGQRKVGTDLRHVTAKLSPSFINSWIWAPKSFRPSTKMPHFFMLENSSSSEELRRTRQEARAITEYLVQTASPYEIKNKPDPTVKGDAKDGLAIFETIGCQGCHTNLNNPGKTKGTTVAKQWITTDLIKNGQLARALEPTTRQELPHTLLPALTKDGKPPTEDQLRQEVEKQLPKALEAAVAKAAADLYGRMVYNERQLYVLEHLEPGSIIFAPQSTLPGEAKPEPSVLNEAKYPDGTPKPVFAHHGPELSGVGTKLLSDRTPEQARAWLFDWLKEPRHYSEYTLMPQLRLSDQQAADLVEYLLAQKRTNDRPDDPWEAHLADVDTPKQIELTAFFLRSRFSVKTANAKADENKELTRLATEALTTQDVDGPAAARQAQSLTKDQKRMVFLGKKLISHYGCMSCHAINGAETLTSPCANLSDWGQKSVDKLDYGYLDPHRIRGLPEEGRDLKIPMVNGLSARAVNLLAPHDSRPATAPVAEAEPGPGTSDALALDQKEKSHPEPVQVGWPELEHTRVSWITQKLKNTRIYDRGRALLEPGSKKEPDGLLTEPGKPYDKLKMPTFYLNDQQVHAIVTFVISNRDRLIGDKLLAKSDTERSRQIAYGRALTQKYNCVNCHQVEGNLPGVQQYYAKDDLTTKAPPSLRGEGNKIQHEWLFNFLKNVEKLRPIPVIRMPTFPLTDEESTAISLYFASVSNKEANDLAKVLDPIAKYRTTAQQLKAAAELAKAVTHAATQPTTGSTTLASAKPAAPAVKKPSSTADILGLSPNPQPGDDWYKQPTLQIAAAQLTRWALSPERQWLNENQVSPLKNVEAELEKNYKTLLFKAEFTHDLYRTPYPLADSGMPDISTPDFEARFKKGEAMFYEMQCLQCHVLNGKRSTELSQDEIKTAANARAPNLALARERLQRRWVRHWVQEPPLIQVNTAMPPFFTGLIDKQNKPVFGIIGQSWPRAQSTLRPAEQIEADYGKTVDEQTALVLDFLYAAGARHYTAVPPPAATAPPPLKTGAPQTPSTPDTGGDASKESPALAPVKKAPTEGPETLPAEKDAELKRQPASSQGASPPAGSSAAPSTDKQPAPPPPKAPQPPPMPAGAAANEKKPDPAGKSALTGKVIFVGQPPEPQQIDMSGVAACAQQHPDAVQDESIVVNPGGTLKNVVVYVSAGLPQDAKFAVPKDPVVLDQKGCMYHPHAIALMAGQTLLVKNSDPFLHNIHALCEKNSPFNLGQQNVNAGEPKVFQQPEQFRIKCDVHPWMHAMVCVIDNPFFAVSSDKGTFSITGLPPGAYTLTAHHEVLGDQQQDVKILQDKPAEVSFTFQPPTADASGKRPMREVRLAKTPSQCDRCETGAAFAKVTPVATPLHSSPSTRPQICDARRVRQTECCRDKSLTVVAQLTVHPRNMSYYSR